MDASAVEPTLPKAARRFLCYVKVWIASAGLRRRAALACALLLLQAGVGGLGGAVWAAEPVRYCDKPVRAAVFEFGMLYSQAQRDGFDKHLLEELGQRSGCTVTVVPLPRQRIWAELEAGTVDVATAVLAAPEREALGHLVPYLKSRNLFLMRTETARGVKHAADFLNRPELRLGVVRGFRYEPGYEDLVARLRAQGRVVEAAYANDNLRNLAKGVVDGVISQPGVFRPYVAELGLVDKLVLSDWIPKDQFAVGNLLFSKKAFSAAQARHWAELLAQLRNDGTLQKLASHYLPADEAADLVFVASRPGGVPR